MKFIKIFLFTVLAIFSIGFFSNQVAAASGSGSVTVTVVNPPTATLTADATTVPYNTGTTLHGTSTGNVVSCTVSWPGGSNTQGASLDVSTGNLTTSTTYSLVCDGGSIAGSSNTSTITINVSAQPKYTLTITTAGTGGGTVTPTSGTTYNSGTSVPLGATANGTSTFGGWSGTGCTTGTVTMDADKSCTATFTASVVNYTVTGTSNAGGTITPPTQSVTSGSKTTLNVNPSSGYSATASGCGGSLSGTTYTTGPITANCTVTATFTATLLPPDPVTGLTVVTSVSPKSCGNDWLAISFNSSARATSYQVFRDGVAVSSSLYNGTDLSFSDTKLVLGQSYTYTVKAINSAGFATSGPVTGTVAGVCPVTLSITTAGTGSGTVTGAGSYTAGTVVSMTATANGTSTFAGWSGTGCTTGTVTMDADKSCIATFTTVGSISVLLSASSTSVYLPTSSTTLSWLTTGTPDSCTASNAWSGSKALSGSELRSGMTAGTYNYVITCSKTGTADATANVSVVVYPDPPVVTLSATPTTGTSPLTSTLSWTVSGGATSCTASNGWSGSKTITGGSQSISGISSSTTYILVCANAGGNSNIASVTVNPTVPVGAISVAISASPTSITLPTSSTTLTWTTGGSPDSCTASNFWSGSKSASGGSEVRSGMTAGTYNYVITCSKAGTTDATANVSVVVNPAVVGAITVAITAAPTSMTLPTSSTTLTWTTGGSPDSCTASNFWSGTKTASGGSEVRSGMTAGTYKYVITCSKAGTTDATANVSVVVNPVTIVIPPTPTGLTATASICGNDLLNIAWNASTGATSYQVYRDGGATAVYNGSATLFSDTGLVLGSTHTYKVKATNSAGSSALSVSASGTVAPVCKFALTITKAGTGTGTVTPTSGTTYNSGAVVVLNATPNATSTFVGWTGNADCTDASVTMDAAKSCIATFTFKTIVCSAPLTQTVKVACDVNANGDAATSGQVTRKQTKTAPSCTFGTPVDSTNSVYVSDDCVYPNNSCTAPLTKTVTVPCDVNANGDAATSGVVTRIQTKSAYPACAFPSTVDTTNSNYVSDTCVYPTGGGGNGGGTDGSNTCTNGATNYPDCTVGPGNTCLFGGTYPNCLPNTTPVNGHWTQWSPLPHDCYESVQISNYIKATNGGVDDPAGLINPKKTRNYTYDQCPVTTLGVKFDGKTINDGTVIPYNSKVLVDWSALNATGGCSCTYSDSIKPETSCGSVGPIKSSALKRDTTYTVVCKGDYNLTSLESFKVLVGKINTNYLEN